MDFDRALNISSRVNWACFLPVCIDRPDSMSLDRPGNLRYNFDGEIVGGAPPLPFVLENDDFK